ncbi:hypothetical protein PanWU01x14_064000 [Parasponia andersonii]|uniref:Uncharacterized protein n=1 Tax=Parasponia andersonii TaxID=3476 RepID=A0A2P5DH62_PARAD|nr:hypothetical protein PanWU01x14_064000 [Parasponia andersonii]
MEENNYSSYNNRIQREAPQLATSLKEMKDGIDVVRRKVQALTAKVVLLLLCS